MFSFIGENYAILSAYIVDVTCVPPEQAINVRLSRSPNLQIENINIKFSSVEKTIEAYNDFKHQETMKELRQS